MLFCCWVVPPYRSFRPPSGEPMLRRRWRPKLGACGDSGERGLGTSSAAAPGTAGCAASGAAGAAMAFAFASPLEPAVAAAPAAVQFSEPAGLLGSRGANGARPPLEHRKTK